MSKLNILISGGGISGPCLAFWLHKRLNAAITLIERAPEPRTSGQAIDIRDAAVDVIKLMGLEEIIKSKTTTEEGMSFVYADCKTTATFPATGDDKSQGFTSEYEILRGDLSRIFYDITKNDVEYIFDESIANVEHQENGKVKVTFVNYLPQTEYDLVVGGDGINSNTRRIVFGTGPDGNNYLKRLGQYCSFFTIPRIESDTKFAQWFNATKGRMCMLRPDQYGETRAYLAVTDWYLSRFDGAEKAMREGRDAQIKWIEEEFQGAGWQIARVVEGMKNSKDFYMSEIAQVTLPEFVKGHIAMVGDAGYCGIYATGTSAGIVGAYVLAGELSKSPSDIPNALQQYQSTMRPFIKRCQGAPPYSLQLACPQTEWGIAVFNRFIGLLSSAWVRSFASKIGSLLPNSTWKLPVYEEVN